jgi:hypothetical protein
MVREDNVAPFPNLLTRRIAMQHTPGPWIDRRLDGNQQITITAVAFRGPNVLALVRPPLTKDNPDDEMEIWKCTDKDVAEAGANARLIAAAPDLLSVLVEIVEEDGFRGSGLMRKRIAAAKAAIAKAKGGDL